MKQFIKKTIAYSCLIILTLGGMECYLLTKSNEYSYKKNYIEQYGNNISTLILGHSHAGNGIDPQFIGDSTFNMAISGRNHYYDAIIAEKYIPRLSNLKCVIWPLGYNFQYFSYRYPVTSRKAKETDLSSTYKCMYEKYMGIPANDGKPQYYYWSEFIHSNLDFTSRMFKKDFFDIHQCEPSGFERLEVKSKAPTWKTDKLPGIVDYDNDNASKALMEGLDDFKRIAQVCKNAGVRLVVVTLPCHQSFLEQTTARGMKEMNECVDIMKEVYPEMEYYNYISDERFGDDDFYNSSHLTDIGAKKFSLYFRQEALKQ